MIAHPLPPRIVIPFLSLRGVLQSLRRDRHRQTHLPVAVNRIGDGVEYSNASLNGSPHRLLLRMVDSTSEWNRSVRLVPTVSTLLVGTGSAAGLAAGWIARPGHAASRPLPAILEFPGPGMETLPPGINPRSREPDVPADERWSRTRSVLGTGFDRIQGIPFGVVGAGRLGSTLVSELVRTGVHQLFVVDPDHVELSNLGESDFGEADLGQNKADSLRRRFAEMPWHPEIQSIPHSVTHRDGIDAIRRSRIILSCADHGSARMVAGLLAVAYHRVLVDVGTLIQQEGEAWTRGLDVRVLLPGDRCLQCFGSVSNVAEATGAVRSPDAESRVRRERNWRIERTGSLRSLNLTAVGLALRLIEDVIGGRLDRSTWVRMQFDRQGRPHMRSVEPPPAAANACWCRWAGTGELAFSRFNES